MAILFTPRGFARNLSINLMFLKWFLQTESLGTHSFVRIHKYALSTAKTICTTNAQLLLLSIVSL